MTRRVHVIGAPGSGKSTLARAIGERIGAPVHGLDERYREGGGTRPLRPAAERDAEVAAIAATPTWVTEGVHLGWTDPLIEAADLVVWLDDIGWLTASRRMARRFGAGGAAGLRDGSGRGLGRRLRDGLGHLRDLAGAVRDSRAYHVGTAGTARLPETRAATGARLAELGERLVVCRSAADRARLLERL